MGVDCLSLGRVGPERNLYILFSEANVKTPGVKRWRCDAPLEARRERVLLHGAGQDVNGRGTQRKRKLAAGSPLFEMLQTIYLTGAGVNQYDVTGDGNRFVVVAGTMTGAPEPLHLVTNWDAELKK